MREPIPYHSILDEIQLAALAVAYDTPLIEEMLRWVRAVHAKAPHDTWMVFGGWNREKKIECLTALENSVMDLRLAVAKMQPHLRNFTAHLWIQYTLSRLAEFLLTLESLNPFIAQVSGIENLFEHQELIEQLGAYLERLEMVQEQVGVLKQALFDHAMDQISFSFNTERHPEEV